MFCIIYKIIVCLYILQLLVGCYAVLKLTSKSKEQTDTGTDVVTDRKVPVMAVDDTDGTANDASKITSVIITALKLMDSDYTSVDNETDLSYAEEEEDSASSEEEKEENTDLTEEENNNAEEEMKKREVRLYLRTNLNSIRKT